jgi:hypothetical protein
MNFSIKTVPDTSLHETSVLIYYIETTFMLKAVKKLSTMERVTSQTTRREEAQLGFRLWCAVRSIDCWRNRQHCIVAEGISEWHYGKIKCNKLKDAMITEESLFPARVDVSIKLLQSKPLNELIFIKIKIILLNIKSHMFRGLMARQKVSIQLHKQALNFFVSCMW